MRCHPAHFFMIAVLVVMPVVVRAAEPIASPRAATVNGEAVPETAIQRALRSVPPEQKAQAREDILNFLIDNVLIDQHLLQLKVDAPKKEVDARHQQIQKEMKSQGQDPAKVLQQLALSEDELRAQIAADLRWENYVKSKVSDTQLVNFFQTHRDWFDDSQVRARHILIAAEPGAAAERETAKKKLAGIKQGLETRLAKEMVKLDTKADANAREEARARTLTEIFAEATKDSDCPSKKSGGDLGGFPRIGVMVEPFAKTAFALQAGQMSDIVETQFGCHLILVTARIPGKAIKFDDVKDEVREAYAEQLRDVMVGELRKTAKIEIKTAKQ